MKKLLSVFILFTSSSLYAQSEDGQFFFQDVRCESRASVNRAEFRKQKLPTGLSLSEDLQELTTYSLNGMDETIEHDFKLNSLGYAELKSNGMRTFMAIPTVLTGTMRNFYVRLDETAPAVEIVKTDAMGAICGGGLVILTYNKSEPSSL